jgi:hypothetical protein
VITGSAKVTLFPLVLRGCGNIPQENTRWSLACKIPWGNFNSTEVANNHEETSYSTVHPSLGIFARCSGVCCAGSGRDEQHHHHGYRQEEEEGQESQEEQEKLYQRWNVIIWPASDDLKFGRMLQVNGASGTVSRRLLFCSALHALYSPLILQEPREAGPATLNLKGFSAIGFRLFVPWCLGDDKQIPRSCALRHKPEF